MKVEEKGATFDGFASFQDATFQGGADFEYAAFNGLAYFQRATFAGTASFADATFAQTSKYTLKTFRLDAPDEAVTVDMAYVRMLGDARVLEPDKYHSWPAGWEILSQGHGDALLAYVPQAG